jgi:predicted phosphodiesterase
MSKSKPKKKAKKSKLEKILFIPDSHIPYEDKPAFNLMLKAGAVFRPDHTIILGDFADFYGVSSHSKDPNRALKLKDEIDATKVALDKVLALGAKNNVFVSGNHEDRLERYLRDKAPELFNFITIPQVLGLKEKGFKYTAYKQTYKIGKLNVTHDCGKAGRDAHMKSLDTFQHNVVIGHTHRLGYIVEGNAQGERHVSAMFGWLGDVEEIDYMHRVQAVKSWSLGFGIGYLDTETGVVYLIPVPIINGTCLIEGKLITL